MINLDQIDGYQGEVLTLPTSTDINVDMSAYTEAQIDALFGNRLVFSNTSSTGGGSDSTLPDIDDLWIGFYVDVFMSQSANGGVLSLSAAKAADIMYLGGLQTCPFLNTSTPQKIELGDDQIYDLSFRLTVRDGTGGGYNIWGISNLVYSYKGGYRNLPATSGTVDWDVLKGRFRTVTPTAAITLTMSNASTSFEELITGVIVVSQGGTAYDITLPDDSKIADGNDLLTFTSGTPDVRKLEMAANETVALTYVYDGTDFIWNASKYI